MENYIEKKETSELKIFRTIFCIIYREYGPAMNEAFMSLGLGVLNMDRFSPKLALKEQTKKNKTHT
jgi:predicted Fe-Mo cluster-binding NifX family protein